jgi:hypothetical protein
MRQLEPSPGATSAAASRTISGKLPSRLVGAVWRDPYHFPEHLVLTAHEQLADPCVAWASRVRARVPEATRAELAADLQSAAVGFARTNGALAGTPFLTALVPAYMSVLWEQARMTMKIAALTAATLADRTARPRFSTSAASTTRPTPQLKRSHDCTQSRPDPR